MIARDLMTREVVTVPEDMAVATVARVLAEAGVSAVPVTDPTNRLLGIVAELDLIRRLAEEAEGSAAAAPAPSGWLASLLADERRMAERYSRVHGLRAGDVMTRQVATVTEDTPAAAIARLMEEKAIRSVPVVAAADGTLRGIVSRADLLRALMAPPPPPRGPEAVRDDGIRRSILDALRRQPWADVRHLMVEVQDGTVTLEGHHRSPEAQQAVRVLVEGIEGVRAVEDRTRPEPPIYRYGFGGPL